MATTFTRSEKGRLKELAARCWEAELAQALVPLADEFRQWSARSTAPGPSAGDAPAPKGPSAFELSRLIHAFHNGIAREIENRYSSGDTELTVARGIAIGLIPIEAAEGELREKLAPLVDRCREWARD